MPAESAKIIGERSMTSEEHQRWNDVRTKMYRVRDYWDSVNAKLNMIIITSIFCKNNGIEITALDDIGPIEKEFIETKNEIDKLTNLIHDAEMGYYGIRYKNGDFDIVTKSNETVSGLGFPAIIVAAVGVVSFVAILARWTYLELKTEEINNKFNEIIEHADSELCSDPNSEICKNWKNRKQQKDYKKEETLSQTIQHSLKTAGKGLSMGLLIAIPLIAYSFFGSRK